MFVVRHIKSTSINSLLYNGSTRGSRGGIFWDKSHFFSFLYSQLLNEVNKKQFTLVAQLKIKQGHCCSCWLPCSVREFINKVQMAFLTIWLTSSRVPNVHKNWDLSNHDLNVITYGNLVRNLVVTHHKDHETCEDRGTQYVSCHSVLWKAIWAILSNITSKRCVVRDSRFTMQIYVWNM